MRLIQVVIYIVDILKQNIKHVLLFLFKINYGQNLSLRHWRRATYEFYWDFLQIIILNELT